MTVQLLFLGKLTLKTKTVPFFISFLFFFSLTFFFQKRVLILLFGITKSGYFLTCNGEFTDSHGKSFDVF